jgi:transposase InsO family protein
MRYGTTDGLILHSDRGSQYTSVLFRETLQNKSMQQSMGRSGSCFDNARMESFYATLKKELIHCLPLWAMTRKEVRAKIFEWIESYYNLRRRYTANESNLPPLKKRKCFFRKTHAA